MGKMKRFVDMEYQRPDFEAEKAARRQYVEQIEQAKSKEELVDVIVKEDERSRMMWTMYDLAYIRNTIDTTDPFYEQEMSNFYKEIGELSLLGQQAEEAVLRSPYKSGIEEKFGPLPLRDMETGLKLMSPNVVEDLTEESRLCQEYNRLVSSCTAEFHGETCTFSTLFKYMQNVDRSVRKESFQVWASMYEGIGDRLDDIYERMVAVRSRIAEKLGFDSYISYIYTRFGRYDYGPEDVKKFRGYVKDQIVPVCERLFKEQAESLGLSAVTFYDEQLKHPDGNAAPTGKC